MAGPSAVFHRRASSSPHRLRWRIRPDAGGCKAIPWPFGIKKPKKTTCSGLSTSPTPCQSRRGKKRPTRRTAWIERFTRGLGKFWGKKALVGKTPMPRVGFRPPGNTGGRRSQAGRFRKKRGQRQRVSCALWHSSALKDPRGGTPLPVRPRCPADGGNGETRDNSVCHRRGLSITLISRNSLPNPSLPVSSHGRPIIVASFHLPVSFFSIQKVLEEVNLRRASGGPGISFARQGSSGNSPEKATLEIYFPNAVAQAKTSRAGLPATRPRGGTSRVTTEPGATTAPAPTERPGRMMLPAPIQAFRPIRTGP